MQIQMKFQLLYKILPLSKESLCYQKEGLLSDYEWVLIGLQLQNSLLLWIVWVKYL